MKEKGKVNLITALSLLLIMANVICIKSTGITASLSINNSVLIYPFTFLMVGLLMALYGPKVARTGTLIALKFQLVFLGILMIISLFPSSAATSYNNAVMNFLFIPKTVHIVNDIYLSYPNLYSLFATVISFTAGKFIFIALYDVLKNSTPTAITFGLSMIIAYLIDTILFISIKNIGNLLSKSITFVTFIRELTGQFIGVFLMSILLIIIFIIIKKIIKKRNQSDLPVKA